MTSIRLPFDKRDLESLSTGDEITLNGQLLIMRDAASKRLKDNLDSGIKPEFDLAGETVFYAGPAPMRSDGVINSIGPTTAKRMDAYLPMLAELGVVATLGKGERSPSGLEAMKAGRMLYLVTIGGAAALLARYFIKLEVLAWPDLGPEAVYRAVVEDLPAFVAFDRQGRDLFSEQWLAWRRSGDEA